MKQALKGLVAVAIALAAMADVARAQDDAAERDFDALLDRALAHYQAREYEAAIGDFRAALAIRAEPEIVYNIARSLERLARPEEAIAEYERFVAMPGTTAELRTRAHGSIRALREELEAARAGAALLTSPTTSTAATTTVASAPEPESETAAPAQPPAEGGSVLGPVGWTLLGVGAVALGVGIGFAVLTIDLNRELERATLPREQIRLRDEVKTDALVADVLLIGGGVVAATGIVLVIVEATASGDEPPSDEASTLVLPFAGPRSAGLTLRATF